MLFHDGQDLPPMPVVEATPTLRVLIVEDELIVAWLARDELEHAGFVVCGMAATEHEAVRLALAERPDVALVDIRLAQGSGLHAARPMEEAGIAVLFVTGHRCDALEAGVGLGCLDKPYAGKVLPEAVRIVHRFHRTGRPPAALPPGLHLSARAAPLSP
jgi:two-component system, response regulator PdtaR